MKFIRKIYILLAIIPIFAVHSDAITFDWPDQQTWRIVQSNVTERIEMFLLEKTFEEKNDIAEISFSRIPGTSLPDFIKNFEADIQKKKEAQYKVTKLGEMRYQIEISIKSNPGHEFFAVALTNQKDVLLVGFGQTKDAKNSGRWAEWKGRLLKASIDPKLRFPVRFQFETIEEAMKKQAAQFMLLVISQAIDERPIWSNDSRYVIFNEMGRWYKIDLRQLFCTGGTLRGNAIAIVSFAERLNSTQQESESHKLSNRFDPRKVTSKKGLTVELRQKELSTQLVTTSGSVEKTWWESDLENSHSIAISPDDRYAAFISEQNGIVIMKLPE